MNPLGRFRLITFDVTNTLLKFRSSPGRQYGEIGALFGVLCNNDSLAQSFKHNWHKMNKSYPNFGKTCRMDWQIWWRKLIDDTFADSGSRLPAHKLEQFCVHLLDLYKSSACWQHCNGSVDLLNYLRMQQQLAKSQKKPTFSMGIISNFDPRLSTLLSNMKIAHYFDFIINSYDSNVEKPDGKIFKLAINQSDVENLKPFECLHVGDGPITDYLAAKNQGWNTALIHEKNYAYLLHKYGDRIEEHLVFPSLYDFHKKLSNNCIEW